jgi:hypothetical protein
MWVAVELAEQSIPILLGQIGQLLNKVLNLFPAGLSERLRAAEVDGIGLHQFGIELVLADDLAEAVAHLRTGAVAVSIAVRILWRDLFIQDLARPDFFDRADSDAIGLA